MSFLNTDSKTIIVLGDIMLDIQIHGDIEKMANEAPIPVLRKQDVQMNLGGCGNVLMNLRALGSKKLFLVSMVGDDIGAQEIRKKLKDCPEITPILMTSPNYYTTVKTRGFAKNKIVFRYDNEERRELSPEDLAAVISSVENIIETTRVDSIILSDYNKGFLGKKLSQHVISLANRRGIPTFVDPKVDYTKYIGCTIFKPNIKEILDIFGIAYRADKLREIHETIRARVNCSETVITLSEQGITFLTKSGEFLHERTRSTEVADVTGAGDVVISILAYFYERVAPRELIQLATWMGTHSVKFMGTYVIRSGDLLEANRAITGCKRVFRENLGNLKCPIIVTNGCFDIVHEGHIALFKHCRSIVPAGGAFVVALNGDDSIRRLKGASRPINSVDARVALLSQFAMIDWIVVFDEDTPYELYKTLRPNTIVKGGDYTADSVIGAEFSEHVEIFTYMEGKSTTKIVERIHDIKQYNV
jgi:D-beta-D-heptose 7-phosphate kinase/D-beta-D-heptose 1-phosphate adenosyltransferase